MAGRIRSIKPEILEDTKTATLSHLEYRLFTGSWLLADDYGNLRGDPDYVRGQVVWSSRESRETVAKALETLATVGLLARYVVRGQVYFHVTNWEKHQRVDKPGRPRMPGPDQSEQVVATDSRDSLESPGNPRETPATDLRPPTSDKEEERGASRPHLCPSEFVFDLSVAANQRAYQKAEARGLDIPAEMEAMRDWSISSGAKGKKTDWQAAARNWLKNAKGNGPRPAWQTQQTEIRVLKRLGEEQS